MTKYHPDPEEAPSAENISIPRSVKNSGQQDTGQRVSQEQIDRLDDIEQRLEELELEAYGITMEGNVQGEAETVIDETINAYRVQKLENGHIRIQSGGLVVNAPTYYEALKRYAEHRKHEVENAPEHLRPEKMEAISDGFIELKSVASSGFTPEEILDEVTMQPLDLVLDHISAPERGSDE